MTERNTLEVSLDVSKQEKIKSLSEYVTSPEGQDNIVGFMENLRTELGSKEGWFNVCKEAEKEYQEMPVNVNIIVIELLIDLFKVSVTA